MIDRDADGRLTRPSSTPSSPSSELHQAAAVAGLSAQTPSLFQILDANGDGRLSVREVREAWAPADRPGAGREGVRDPGRPPAAGGAAVRPVERDVGVQPDELFARSRAGSRRRGRSGSASSTATATANCRGPSSPARRPSSTGSTRTSDGFITLPRPRRRTRRPGPRSKPIGRYERGPAGRKSVISSRLS